jgi:hypothetical protein
MQLPRGTFYGIRKDTTIPSLLSEAAQSRFTGSILISSREGSLCLVIQRGQVILAEYRHLVGDLALQEIQQHTGSQVDAELTTLNEVQMNLALEFNRGYSVTPVPGSSVFFGKKESVIPEAGKRPLFASGIGAPTPRRITDPADLDLLVNGDLEALDRIDLEKIAGKMRISAVTIANKLELDHLVNGEW